MKDSCENHRTLPTYPGSSRRFHLTNYVFKQSSDEATDMILITNTWKKKFLFNGDGKYSDTEKKLLKRSLNVNKRS